MVLEDDAVEGFRQLSELLESSLEDKGAIGALLGPAAQELQAFALISAAISLKRIADVLEGTPEKHGLVDGLMDAIQQASRP